MGGPLVSDLDTALRNYPHTTLRLEGSIRREAPAFIEQQGIGEGALGGGGVHGRWCHVPLGGRCAPLGVPCSAS